MLQPAGAPVRRSPDWPWAVAAVLALVLVIRAVVTSGSWLDEYWQLWISGAPAGELVARLTADAHPPWFNLFARPILSLTGDDIVAARLVNLVLACGALGAGLWAMPGLDRGLRWRMLLLVIASAGVAGMSQLAASFRVYVWLLSLAALQAAVLTALVLKRPVPPAIAAVVTGVSVALHYVHAAGAIAIALVSLVFAWKHDRRSFAAIVAGMGAGVALDLVTGLVQLPHWRATFDVNWIADAGGGGATASLMTVGAAFAAFNIIAAAMLAVGLIVRRSMTVLMVLAPIPLAFVGWMVIESGAPILVPRYMASVTAVLAVAAALAWWELALGRLADAVVALLAALQPLASSLMVPPFAGWEAGARIAAEVRAACPGAPVYAVSPWQFRGHGDSKTQRFEDPVIAFGYGKAGRAYGLDPRFVSRPTPLALDRCPAVVWIEAAHGIDQVAPAKILRHARLTVAEPARTRIIPTPNGAVLLISRVDRLQPRP